MLISVGAGLPVTLVVAPGLRETQFPTYPVWLTHTVTRTFLVVLKQFLAVAVYLFFVSVIRCAPSQGPRGAASAAIGRAIADPRTNAIPAMPVAILLRSFIFNLFMVFGSAPCTQGGRVGDGEHNCGEWGFQALVWGLGDRRIKSLLGQLVS